LGLSERNSEGTAGGACFSEHLNALPRSLAWFTSATRIHTAATYFCTSFQTNKTVPLSTRDKTSE
jgi:hypothetical protein